MFDTAAIVVVGLIGGSFGMALRQRKLVRRVIGIARREATIAEALSIGALDAGTLDTAAVAEADLVLLAPPVLQIPGLLRAMAPHLRPGALVTDAGSTKGAVMEAMETALPPGVELVGGHPMAGSEQVGVLAARADLFEGAIWVLTRAARTTPEGMLRLAELVGKLGATPVEMDPVEHDHAVARISHLPHVVAAALATAAPAQAVSSEQLRLLVAGGFRDTTRIAAGSPEMWRDVCLTNRGAILDALDDFERALAGFRTALVEASGDALVAAFSEGKAARDELVPPQKPTGAP